LSKTSVITVLFKISKNFRFRYWK